MEEVAVAHVAVQVLLLLCLIDNLISLCAPFLILIKVTYL